MPETLMVVIITALSVGIAFAQTSPPSSDPAINPAANSDVSKGTKDPSQNQPQGPTGPTETTSGGAPATSPQGDSPPGMQAKPNDPKQGIDPKKTKK